MKSNKFQSEEELAKFICDWLEEDGWVLYKEVYAPGSGRTIDIVALKAGVIWLIECKRSLSDSVLEQAYSVMSYGHYVSVATPDTKRTGIVKSSFMNDHGIGHLTVDKWGCDENQYSIHEQKKPKINRLKQDRMSVNYMKRLKKSLDPMHKTAVAGSQSGGQITPWKITVKAMKSYLKRVNKATMKDIVNSIDHHYSTPASAKTCLAKAILNDWIDGIEQDGKYYSLRNDHGNQS